MSRTTKDRPRDIVLHSRAYPDAARWKFHSHEYFGQPVMTLRAVRDKDGKPVTETTTHEYMAFVRVNVGEKPVLRPMTRTYTSIVREAVRIGTYADFCTTNDRELPDGIYAPCSMHSWRYGPGERRGMRAIERSERATIRQAERVSGRALAHEYNTFGDADSFDNMPDFDSYHTRGVMRWD